MSTLGGHPRRFYAAAIGIGASFATITVAVPLQVEALDGRSGLAGAVLAGTTVSIALGAIAAGFVAPRIGGGPRTLALALLVSGAGNLSLLATSSVAGTAVAGALVGAGIGMFWVSSQLVLGRTSGDSGSATGFLSHYAAYMAGAVVGSSLTGGVVAGAERAGLTTTDGIRLSALVGVGAAGAALVVWRPLTVSSVREARPTRRVSPSRHLTVQAPDLLLVGGLALLLPLAPVVLAHGYRLGPFVIGLVMSALSLARIVGTFAARALIRACGTRRTILILLCGAGTLSLLLCLALTASVFVAILLATTLTAAGAWPLVVDSAQARVPPDSRHGLTVVWNAREYGVLASSTLVGGWLLGAVGSPVPLFALAAVLIVAAAACSAVVCRRPVFAPAL